MTTTILALLALLGQHNHHASGLGAGRPAKLMEGMGKFTHPIHTSNSEAQKFFDQGMNLFYGFNRDAAFASFERAAELDPANPMPKWGMAMSVGPYLNMDLDPYDMKKFCSLLQGVDHPYAKAARARCPNGNDVAYIAAMRRLMRSNPDDLDAATLFADAIMVQQRWKWYDRMGNPGPGMAEAIAVLEEVMRRNPEHPGANHLYIHAVEMSPTPERAIPSAQRLMGIVPAAGHLVHMPGHIWLRTGNYDISAETNERAVELDQKYFKDRGSHDTGYMLYLIHNMHFVVFSRQMQGRRTDTLKAAKELTETIQPLADAGSPMADMFLPYEWFMMERFAEWDSIMQIEKPSVKLPISTALWHWARAMALTGQGKDAVEEQSAFQSAAAKVPAEAMWLNSHASTVLKIAGETLSARLAKTDTARLRHWRAAIAAQDSLAYDEPPDWYYPVRQSYGAALLKAGQAKAAEAVFREAMKHSRRDGRILYGLMESLKAQGKDEAASMVEREYQDAWRKADTSITLDRL